MYAVDAVRGAAREMRSVLRAETDLHERFRRHLTAIVVMTLMVDAVCTLLVFLFERDAQQTQIKSIGSALFWTTSQLLTVSSSFQNPITPGGQILDVFMEVWAMIVVSGLTASLGSFLISKSRSK